MLGSGQAQGCAGDDDWIFGRSRFLAAVNLPAALKDVGEEVAEFGVVIGSRWLS